MSKGLKKTLLFFVFLVAAIIIITCIYLLMNSIDSGTSPSTTPSVSPSSVITPSETPSALPSPADTGSFIRTETPDGIIYTITVPGSFVTYSLGVDESVFQYAGNTGGDKIASLKDPKEFIQISFSEGVKATELAPVFLDRYIDYKEFEQSGENYISGTTIAGETVTGNDGQTEVTAWLVDTDNGVLAVVISYDLQDKAAQLGELDKILATLTIEQ